VGGTTTKRTMTTWRLPSTLSSRPGGCHQPCPHDRRASHSADDGRHTRRGEAGRHRVPRRRAFGDGHDARRLRSSERVHRRCRGGSRDPPRCHGRPPASGGGGGGRRRVAPHRCRPPRHRLGRGGGVGDAVAEPIVYDVPSDLSWRAVGGDADTTAAGQPPNRPASQATSEQPQRLDRRRPPVSPPPGRR